MVGSYYSFPCSILSTGKDYKTSQRYHDVLTTSKRVSLRSMDSFQRLTLESPSLWHRSLAPKSWALLKDLALYDNENWNDPRDFTKPVKAISLPQDVPSTSDRRLIKIENQVQRLMETHLAPTNPTQETPQGQMNFTSTNDPTREELRGKGIKSPSKSLSPKYLSQSSLAEKNRNPSSSKRVYFVNSIVILTKEERNVKTSTTKYEDHKTTMESEEEFEEETEDEIKEEEEDIPKYLTLSQL
ncbi:hypothetical protein Tco_1220740 [Tanacetum coccineum]